ncbi:MAG: diguanylate cyclase [Pseudomonadota bacterium]
MTFNDVVRIVIALVICGALFVSDLVMSVEMNEVQLYPLVLLPLYRVQLRYLLPVFSVLAIGLIVLGYCLAPDPDFWDGLSNRTFSIVMVVVTALSLGRLAVSERKLMLRALTDPLTGVFNRRTFLELSGKEEARARRSGSPTSVLMMDIDHFKRGQRYLRSSGRRSGDQDLGGGGDQVSAAHRHPGPLWRRGIRGHLAGHRRRGRPSGRRAPARRARESGGAADRAEVRFTVSIGIATFMTGGSARRGHGTRRPGALSRQAERPQPRRGR